MSFGRLGSVLGSQDGSQIDLNSKKIEFPSLSVSASFFRSIFHRFLLPASTPRISKIEPPLQREHDFSKNRLSKLCTFLIPFGCQLASIFPPKMHQNPSKNRFQKASIFWIDFGIDLLSILAPFWKPTWGHWAPRGAQKRPGTVFEI